MMGPSANSCTIQELYYLAIKEVDNWLHRGASHSTMGTRNLNAPQSIEVYILFCSIISKHCSPLDQSGAFGLRRRPISPAAREVIIFN